MFLKTTTSKVILITKPMWKLRGDTLTYGKRADKSVGDRVLRTDVMFDCGSVVVTTEVSVGIENLLYFEYRTPDTDMGYCSISVVSTNAWYGF